jgi:hypothetical protein
LAHYAELSPEGKVIRVIVVSNTDCLKDTVKASYPELVTSLQTISGKTISKEALSAATAAPVAADVEWEDEKKGADFCTRLLGGRWVRTSYSSKDRFHYAGIGYTYDAVKDAFVPPQPYESWKLDAEANWQPPEKYPDDGKMYTWDEKTLSWLPMEGIKP